MDKTRFLDNILQTSLGRIVKVIEFSEQLSKEGTQGQSSNEQAADTLSSFFTNEFNLVLAVIENEPALIEAFYKSEHLEKIFVGGLLELRLESVRKALKNSLRRIMDLRKFNSQIVAFQDLPTFFLKKISQYFVEGGQMERYQQTCAQAFQLLHDILMDFRLKLDESQHYMKRFDLQPMLISFIKILKNPYLFEKSPLEKDYLLKGSIEALD